MLNASLKNSLAVLVCALFFSNACIAIAAQIISHDIKVSYSTPTRLSPVNGKIKANMPEVKQSNRQIENIKNIAPVFTVKNESNNPAKTNKNIAEKQKTSGEQKVRVINYEDVYALSSYAKYLQLNSYYPKNLSFLDDTLWQEAINKASLKYALSPEFIAAVIKVESDFNVNAVSSKGAEGLMQIMPSTQDYLNLHDPFNPELNIMAGSAYLREQLDKFGSEELALAAYNAGPANVMKYKGIPPFAETQNYVVKVLKYKNKYMNEY